MRAKGRVANPAALFYWADYMIWGEVLKFVFTSSC